MSHHDHHEHSHGHSHHNHSHETSHSDSADKSKLIKMVEHWVLHNEDHAKSYRDWADRARRIGSDEVAGVLEEVARTTQLQNEQFQKALRLLKDGSSER